MFRIKKYLALALLVSCSLGAVETPMANREFVAGVLKFEQLKGAHKKEQYKDVLKKFTEQTEVKQALKDISTGCDGVKKLVEALAQDSALKDALVKELREVLALPATQKPVEDLSAELKKLLFLMQQQSETAMVPEGMARGLLVSLAVAEVVIELQAEEGGLETMAHGLSAFVTALEAVEKTMEPAAVRGMGLGQK